MRLPRWLRPLRRSAVSFGHVKLGSAAKPALAHRRSIVAYANASFSDGRVVSTKTTLTR